MHVFHELSVAKELAITAGEEILNIYNSHKNFTIERKEDDSPLTLADKKSHQIIYEGLKQAFPKTAVLSEEMVDDYSRLNKSWVWIVDPLDGTKEFIKRNGQFTVNIALTYAGQPVLGVIYVPGSKTLYYASKGHGAFKKEDGLTDPIKVTDKLKNLTVVGSASHQSPEEIELIHKKKHLINDYKSIGSSLKGLMVAEGMADVYYRFGLTSEWDTCAMQIIVEEAGAIFKQLDHTDMLYNRENTLNEKGFFIVNKRENIWI